MSDWIHCDEKNTDRIRLVMRDNLIDLEWRDEDVNLRIPIRIENRETLEALARQVLDAMEYFDNIGK